MPEPRSVPDLAALDALDLDEVLEGYWEGRAGEPEPGHNRSLSFWHGWRCGATDFGHRPQDPELMALARLVVSRSREATGHAGDGRGAGGRRAKRRFLSSNRRRA